MMAMIFPTISIVIIRGYTAALNRRYRESHHRKVEDVPEGNDKAEKKKRKRPEVPRILLQNYKYVSLADCSQLM